MGKNIDYNSISVIIPTYNSERTIERAIVSVLKQTYIKYIKEIIIINDGSNDGTELIVKKIISKYTYPKIYLISQDNSGVSIARNRGMKMAKGDWIALLDSDDEWLPKRIEEQVILISQHEDIDFIGGDFDVNGVSILGRKIVNLHKASIKEVCMKMFPQTSTVLFKKKIFNEIGGYDSSRHYAEDGQYFFKICESYGYYYQPGQNIIYDRGKRGFGSSGLSANLKEMHKGNLINFKELLERKSISFQFYIFILFFSYLKYFRRILICQIEKMKQ